MYKEYYLIKGKFIPFISGSKGSKGCFAAGSKILTESGEKAIEYILPGDKVASFNHSGCISYNKVTHIYFHQQQSVSKVTLWDDREIFVTPNHWILTENNTFKELQHFSAEEALIGLDNSKMPIKSIEHNFMLADTFNLTVEDDHTYIVEGFKVHNKGGGKSSNSGGNGGTEADDTLFSTDLLFVLAALGEGPIYRVNPNGPQDIEINEGPIDDLLNIDGDGLINPNLFYYTYNTGTLNQPPIKVFGDATIVPQSLSNPVVLKKGNKPGITPSNIRFMSTSVGTPWDQINFKFNVQSLLFMDNNGNINGWNATVQVFVYDSTGTEQIASATRRIDGKTSGAYKFDIDIVIPEDKISANGYKFSIFTPDNDPTSSKTQNSVAFYGWDEIQYGERAYPRTALIGYAISATSKYQGNIPTVTSMVKGLLCRVPSNYNQPILESGEIDWREVEVSDSARVDYGYRLQKSGSTVLTDPNPVIYDGLWDGSFVYNWTQNAVWIVYEMLTNKTWGLGIPAGNIDKYNFYKVAQYCDAVEQRTGKYVGVDATADGTYRYKPRTTYQQVREVLIGLPNGSPIKERRFVFDGIISSKKQIMDTLNQITASFRGILFYSAGKLSLNVDMPDELPMAIFNETNIIDGSLLLSGLKESDIITGVEVSFLDPLNHYKRETVRISDDNILREVNLMENIKQIDLTGCTRRSIAVRFAQYLLASGKYLRRKAQFRTSLEAIQLTVGDIISLSTRVTGTSWGYAGKIIQDSTTNNNALYMEHFTSPGVPTTFFTTNTYPIGVRIMKQDSDKVDYYLLSNSGVSLQNTGNVFSGYDYLSAVATQKFNRTNRTWVNVGAGYDANSLPKRGDLWTMGEIDPNNIFTSQSDKLFKITQVSRTEEHEIEINAIEYISNVYVDSETQISYTPVLYKDVSSVLVPPPAPILSLTSRPVREADGSIQYVVDINSSTDTTGYPIAISTLYEIAYPEDVVDITGVNTPPFEAESQSYFNAIGGNISTNRKYLLNDMVARLKSFGIWDRIEDMWIPAAENETQAYMSIKRRVNSIPSTIPPVFTADRGFTFNGSNNYVELLFSPFNNATVMVGNSQSISSYERANVNTDSVSIGAQSLSTRNTLLRPLSPSGLIAASLNYNGSTTGNKVLAPVNDSRKLVLATSNDTIVSYYKEGALVLPEKTPTIGTALVAFSLVMGAANVSSTITLHRATEIAFAHVGAGMSANQVAEFNNIVNNYLTAIGAAV